MTMRSNNLLASPLYLFNQAVDSLRKYRKATIGLEEDKVKENQVQVMTSHAPPHTPFRLDSTSLKWQEGGALPGLRLNKNKRYMNGRKRRGGQE